MTIVFNKGKGPGLHALLIGVGKYPHLEGGKKKPFQHSEGMGQLSSPPESVMHVLEWLVDAPKAANVELRTIDVLVSGTPAIDKICTKSIKLEGATTANVIAAFNRWYISGHAHPDNLMLLYFCGHGVSSGDVQSVLLEDFGSNPLDPFSNAVAIDKTVVGMRRCDAQRQLYLIDACRTVSEEYLDVYGKENSGIPLIASSQHNRLGAVKQHLVRSAQDGAQSFGRDGKPSTFAKALVRGLSGLAATTDDHGDWVVKPMGIYDALSKLMPRIEPAAEQVASANFLSENFSLFSLKGEPLVPVTVFCEPDNFISQATLSYWRQGAQVAQRNPPVAQHWELELPPLEYEFRASLGNGQPQCSRTKSVFPPHTSIAIKCA